MKNVLLLGGTGYIGAAFLHRLTEDGYNVKALSRSGDFDYTDMSKFKEFLDINWHESLRSGYTVVSYIFWMYI